MIDPKTNPLFIRLFWVGSAVLVLGAFVTANSVASTGTIAGFAVAAAALVPAYIWAQGKAYGLPIYPIVSLTYIWTCALPLIQGHEGVRSYAPGDQFTGAITVVIYLLVGTAVWWRFTARRPSSPRTYWGFPDSRSGGIFIAFLASGCLFLSPLPWTFINLPGSLHSAARMGLLALALLSAVVLAFQWGRERLNTVAKGQFAVLLVVYMMLDASGLMIHGAAMLAFSTAAAFALGRGRIPYGPLIIAFIVFTILHSGKWPMRRAYWGESAQPFPGYVPLYAEWCAEGIGELLGDRQNAPPPGQQQTSSVMGRASLLQMILLVETKSPETVPFLDGATYALIPELLVPRFLSPNKPWSQEGTFILSLHYGLQIRDQTLATTIGFGFLAESYANFGWFGVLGLAVITGGITGITARWSAAVPITSFPGLFSFLILSTFLQTEATAATAVTSLSHGLLALLGVGVALMRRIPNTAQEKNAPARPTLAPGTPPPAAGAHG